MTSRISKAVFASLSAFALMLAAETPARSAGAPHAGAPVIAHAPGAHGFGHHRGRGAWTMWPGGGGFFYGPAMSEPLADFVQPPPNDVRYTYTYDVPWDWVHRYPPNVVPSDRPYVPTCPSETVTVPGRGGVDHTVNIMRCY